MFADGSNGSVELAGDSIIIRRKGFANVLTQGVQGDKRVPLKSITAVQFRSAGSMMAGLIQFSILGGREFRGGMLEATKDENAVMFTREQEPSFAALRDVILQRINQPDRPVGGGASAEELERLAALLEKGHLTPEEFADAKKHILGGHPSVALRPGAPAYQSSPVVRGEPGKTKGGCLKTGMITAAVLVGLLVLIGIMNPGPKWGERGYRPRISDKCRDVWASVNVDKDAYVKAVCTPEEQHEIEGYRPE